MLKGLLRLICRVDMDTLVVIVSSWSSFELNSPEERLDALGEHLLFGIKGTKKHISLSLFPVILRGLA